MFWRHIRRTSYKTCRRSSSRRTASNAWSPRKSRTKNTRSRAKRIARKWHRWPYPWKSKRTNRIPGTNHPSTAPRTHRQKKVGKKYRCWSPKKTTPLGRLTPLARSTSRSWHTSLEDRPLTYLIPASPTRRKRRPLDRICTTDWGRCTDRAPWRMMGRCPSSSRRTHLRKPTTTRAR